MTEMVYGAVPLRDAEPVLPRWWRTIDRWSFFSVLILFAIGILLGLAASVPLAEKNGFAPFHYVQRQMFFGGLALVAMMLVSMQRPETVRRLV
jgi:cell division protein FtsW